MEPIINSSFFSAAMRLDLELDIVVTDTCIRKKTNTVQIFSTKKLGLIFDNEHGYLAASSDCGVVCDNALVGIVECSTLINGLLTDHINWMV